MDRRLPGDPVIEHQALVSATVNWNTNLKLAMMMMSLLSDVIASWQQFHWLQRGEVKIPAFPKVSSHCVSRNSHNQYLTSKLTIKAIFHS